MKSNKLWRRLLPAIIAALVVAVSSSVAVADFEVLYRTALTGGAAGALDQKDGTNLLDGQPAIVMTGTYIHHYRLDEDSGAAESSPTVIAPDTNAGSKRWILQTVYSVVGWAGAAADDTLRGEIAGMELSSATDSAHDISISAGACMDGGGAKPMSNPLAYVKQIDAPWAAGTNAGGLLNGTVSASELYNIYAIRNDTTGLADYAFCDKDDNVRSYLPAGYSDWRWIGFVSTGAASTIHNFKMVGDWIIHTSAFEFLTDVNTAAFTSQDISRVAPTGRTDVIRIGANDGSTVVEFGNYLVPSNAVLAGTGTAWADIVSGVQNGQSIVDVTPAQDGTIGIDTNGVSVDIWLKAVKIIR